MDISWRDTTSASTYEAARVHNVFNKRTPQRFPLAVVKAIRLQDIISAVRVATERGCQVAVRSGGHSFPVWSVQDNSILIDLSSLKDIEVNVKERTARVSPSVTSAELNNFLIQQHDLMFPAGHHAAVALGGFLLQGGMGWNCANWGWACEMIDAVEVVTARGEVVFCNVDENPDLFWAARGAGPAFPGIISKFHLRLLPYPRAGFRSSNYTYPAYLYREAFTWALSISQSGLPDTEISVRSCYIGEGDEVCIHISLLCMKATLEEAQAVLNPIHQSHPPGALASWTCREASLPRIYEMQMHSNKHQRHYVENSFIRNDANIVNVLEEGFLRLPTRQSFALWVAMNPRSRQDTPDMAFCVHSDHYFGVEIINDDERDDSRCREHVQAVMKGLEPFSAGAYVGDSELQDPTRRYWTPEKARRLVDIGSKWDPDGRFCCFKPEQSVHASL